MIIRQPELTRKETDAEAASMCSDCLVTNVPRNDVNDKFFHLRACKKGLFRGAGRFGKDL